MKNILLISILFLASAFAFAAPRQQSDIAATICSQSEPGTRPLFIKFDTSTGDFVFEDCAGGDGFTLSGKGKFTVEGCQQKLNYDDTASSPQIKLRVVINTCTGVSSVNLFKDGELFRAFTGRNPKRNNCVCVR